MVEPTVKAEKKNKRGPEQLTEEQAGAQRMMATWQKVKELTRKGPTSKIKDHLSIRIVIVQDNDLLNKIGSYTSLQTYLEMCKLKVSTKIHIGSNYFPTNPADFKGGKTNFYSKAWKPPQ